MKDRQILFFTFPKDAEGGKWRNAVNRVSPVGTAWRPSKETVLCADHFIAGLIFVKEFLTNLAVSDIKIF